MNELQKVLIDVGCIKYGEFTLVSGKTSTYYVDIKKAITNPAVLTTIGKRMSRLIPTDIDSVAGIEIGGVPIVTVLSLHYNLPMVIVRKELKKYGTMDRFIGEVDGKRILLVDDVTTTGGSVIEATKNLRKGGGEIDTVISIVDRGEGAEQNLKDIGVRLFSLVTHDELQG